MITEDPLEQLAIQWFQDTGWNYVHGAVDCTGRRGGGAVGFPGGGLEGAFGGGGAALEARSCRNLWWKRWCVW